MPDNLLKHLPFLSQQERDLLYNNIPFVLAYERGDPVREGVIRGKAPSLSFLVFNHG